ncbi:hypothetical protein FRB93_011368 [Tulasnella sp. JGI-2019a]|nr:hypothetical protein FRB93_011368 [Tulasnella sp. JGI-2019a]
MSKLWCYIQGISEDCEPSTFEGSSRGAKLREHIETQLTAEAYLTTQSLKI